MFISVLDLFTLGIGPSSSHTMGPMAAAKHFVGRAAAAADVCPPGSELRIRCSLKGALAFTGKGHGTDRAVILGLHGYSPEDAAEQDVDALVDALRQRTAVEISGTPSIAFDPERDIRFDLGEPLPEHPNGMIFDLEEPTGTPVLSETYFSIGGGFISTRDEINRLVAPLRMESVEPCPYAFDSANSMLEMADESALTIANMKRVNECVFRLESALDQGLDRIWQSMRACVEAGLAAEGRLPGGLNLPRRAMRLHQQLQHHPQEAGINEWLCVYAMAVNEENAAGHRVVTAPTNGAAGVIPAILYHHVVHRDGTRAQVRDFLLTASAIGGIIKHRSSISGAEVGCQGEVGSASSMAAAGLCAILGGTPRQIEHAAEIALEHHLGMTCDPVQGLVQVPCIERNGFGAVKAHTAATLAMRDSGDHFMPLDHCIAAMKQTGLEMSIKFKETSLGGLAVSRTEC